MNHPASFPHQSFTRVAVSPSPRGRAKFLPLSALAGLALAFMPTADAQTVDIVLESGNSGVIETGTWWNATSASQHHGPMSRYAVVGGGADTMTFRPTLPLSGSYEVYTWSAYFANRPTNVPHRITHLDGVTVVPVNQSGTGTVGTWLSLGLFNFDAGIAGSLQISDSGIVSSSTTYIGADAVRFVRRGDLPPLTPAGPGNLSASAPSTSSISLSWSDNSANEQGFIVERSTNDGGFAPLASLGANATAYSSTGLAAGTTYTFRVLAFNASGNSPYSNTATATTQLPPPPTTVFMDTFHEEVTPLDSSYVTYNASALPVVGKLGGRFFAEVTSNIGNATVHYNTSKGRIDAQLTSFPFVAVVRNVGIGQVADTQSAPPAVGYPYLLAGVMVHAANFAEHNHALVAVGHRGGTPFTVEGKNTRNGVSTVTTLGANRVPLGRADLRVVGHADRTLTVYWQQPNPSPGTQPDNWQPYDGTGALPGTAPTFGAQVYVGLITFASGDEGLPFVGTADRFYITTN